MGAPVAILMYRRSDAEQSQSQTVVELARTARPDAERSDNLPEYSVSELSSAIRRTLEGAYGYVRLRGEISGFRGAHASGHCYFALKAERRKVEAVLWRRTGGVRSL